MPILLTPSTGTSGSTNFAETRDNIVEDALAILGIIGADQTYADFTAGNTNLMPLLYRRLNAMLKAFAVDGLNLWKSQEFVIPLQAGQPQYEVSPRILRIFNIRRRSSTGTDVPMGQDGDTISRNEYQKLPNKTAQGVPVMAYFERQRAKSYVYVWNAPSTGTTDSLVFTGELVMDDLDASGDYPDMPQEALDLLAYNLAFRIQGVVRASMSQSDAAIAQNLYQQFKDFDRDMGSTYFQPAYV